MWERIAEKMKLECLKSAVTSSFQGLLYPAVKCLKITNVSRVKKIVIKKGPK